MKVRLSSHAWVAILPLHMATTNIKHTDAHIWHKVTTCNFTRMQLVQVYPSIWWNLIFPCCFIMCKSSRKQNSPARPTFTFSPFSPFCPFSSSAGAPGASGSEGTRGAGKDACDKPRCLWRTKKALHVPHVRKELKRTHQTHFHPKPIDCVLW